MSLPKYIINFNELTDELKRKLLELIDDELRNKYPRLNISSIEALLEDIKELLPVEQYRGLKKKIDALMYRNIDGIQKVEGKLLEIPPIIMENKTEFKFNKDVYITGLHFNQTGWKKEDTYSLEISKNKIINNAAIKEIGEHKYFNTYFKVNANIPISFILDNRSGNSRQSMVDLEYIEDIDSTIIIDPEVPSIDDIKNDWDIAIVMQWEKDTTTDIDLHGFIDDMHVYFSNKSYEGFYLNFDYTEHKTNTNPEIISVKGYKNKKLDVYLHNYNAGSLKEPVNIKIYNKRSYGNKLLKEFNINIESDNSYLKGVCTIDLNTLLIITLDKKINTIAGGM
ncbi:hypothetical protein [Clostridium sp. JNZ J1-5]